MNHCGHTILGIDPGSRITGYGVIVTEKSRLSYIACGTIRTSDKFGFSARLLEIHQGLTEVIARHRPEVAAVEETFVSRNPKTALKLGHARGVAVLAALQANLTVHDYTVRLIKQAVTGYGQADKTQVQEMVRLVLGLPGTPSSDAADALAVAICHAQRMNFHNSLPQQAKSPRT